MKKLIGLGLGLLLSASNASALDFGVGAKVGTVGVGVDLSVGLTRTLNLRLSLSSIDVDDEDETLTVGDAVEGDVDAEVELDFGANALLFDWFIFDGSFHLTAGAMRQTGDADLTGVLIDPVSFDGGLLLPSDIGTISGDLELADSYQPYIGFGWGRKAGAGGGLSFTVDIGVALLDPSIELSAPATGAGLSQSEVNALLREMESDAEDELDDYEVYPVAAVGLNYAF